jgi:cytochrome c biogenesis protein
VTGLRNAPGTGAPPGAGPETAAGPHGGAPDEVTRDEAARDEAARDKAAPDEAPAPDDVLLDTGDQAPPRPVAGASLGLAGWLRWGWRQLTSMRTALILLFLLAVGSVPGSLLPQQGINPAGVSDYYSAHRLLAPVFGHLSLFNVFGAPWYAAIYLLLFASLVGCVLPRTVRMALTARQPPPRAPRHVTRLPFSASYTTALAPEAALESAARVLSGRRFRLRTGPGWVAAEKGYLRDAGNLLFHIALLGVLVSIGLGGLFGYRANRLLVEGSSFSNTVTALDEFHPGRLVSPGDLQPFSVTLNRFRASYVTSGVLAGQPAAFDAAIRYTATPQDRARGYTLSVNHPLQVDGVRVFLIGHGYAPTFRVTDGTGHVVFSGPVPFVPVETSGLTSDGAIKVPDADPEQLGFAGVFLPTAVAVNGQLESVFPAPLHPMVSLVSYAGNLGMNSGPSQSVFSLNTAGLHRLPVAPRPLTVGQSVKLPDGLGTLTYTGYKQWISLAITSDPGQMPALISGIAVLGGLLLSFLVRRRRMFVRATAGGAGGTVVEVGGLTRSDAAGGFEDEFAGLAAELRRRHQDGPGAPGPGDVPAHTDASLTSAEGTHTESSLGTAEGTHTESSLGSHEGE